MPARPIVAPRRLARRASGDGRRLALTLALAGAGCSEDANPGDDPPNDSFAFPAGLALDPRADPAPLGVCDTSADCGEGQLCAAHVCRAPARWMFVTNAASDLRYNAGSLMAVDLDKLHLWLGRTANIGEPEAEFSDAGDPHDWTLCRKLVLTPQIVECDERFFVDADSTVHTGMFSGVVRGWDGTPDDGLASLLVPVRGDPSVTVAELRGGLGGDDDLELDCGQGASSGHRDARRCAGEHRLIRYRGDTSQAKIAREPFNILVHPDPAFPLAYVTHLNSPDLTLINLAGLDDREGVPRGGPVIIDQARVFVDNSSYLTGGYGLALRPCTPETYDEDGVVLDPGNAPKATENCTLPLVYAAFRTTRLARPVVAMGVSEEEVAEQGVACGAPDEVGLYDFGACPDSLDCAQNWKLPDYRDDCDACKALQVVCDEALLVQNSFFTGGLDTSGIQPGDAILGGMRFSEDGNELFIVQTNPGALLRVDTSLDEDDAPRNLPAGQEEVCSLPTAFATYEDGENRFGLVTCYRSAELFVVDLSSLELVKVIRAGTGPHELAVDLAREYVYIANTLDATISVIDMSRARPTRFSEVARIGTQEPFSE